MNGNRDHLVPRPQLDADGVVRTHYVNPQPAVPSRFAPPIAAPTSAQQRYAFSGNVPIPDGVRDQVLNGMSAGISTLAENLATNGWHHKDSALDIAEATVDIEETLEAAGATTPDEVSEVLVVSGFVQDARAAVVSDIYTDLQQSVATGPNPVLDHDRLVALGSGDNADLVLQRPDLEPEFIADMGRDPNVPTALRAQYVGHGNASAETVNFSVTDPESEVRRAAASSHLISEESARLMTQVERDVSVLDALANNSHVSAELRLAALDMKGLRGLR